MDRDSDAVRNNRLPKSGILSGHKAFQQVLDNADVYSGKYLRVHAVIKELNEELLSPPFTSKVRVGFLVKKKRVKSAVSRNRIKRIIRESYRKLKHEFEAHNAEVRMIITLTSDGYLLFETSPEGIANIVSAELLQISGKMKLRGK